MPPRSLSLGSVVSLVSLVGCGAPEGSSTHTPSAEAMAPPAATEEPAPAAVISALPSDMNFLVVGVVPDKLELDGAIDEWGDVCATDKEPSPTAHARKVTYAPPPTCAILALDADRAVIAGKLGGEGARGFWFSVGMPVEGEFPWPLIVEGDHESDPDCTSKHAAICKRHEALAHKAGESTERFYILSRSLAERGGPADRALQWQGGEDADRPEGRHVQPRGARARRGEARAHAR